MAKIKINIEGHGQIIVKIPKKLTKKTFSDSVAQAVADTMQLVEPDAPKQLHMALGYRKLDA